MAHLKMLNSVQVFCIYNIALSGMSPSKIVQLSVYVAFRLRNKNVHQSSIINQVI